MKKLLISSFLLTFFNISLASESTKLDHFIYTFDKKYLVGLSSEANYRVYEKNGTTVCVRESICDKYDRCQIQFYKNDKILNLQTSQPVFVSNKIKLNSREIKLHSCLKKFKIK